MRQILLGIFVLMISFASAMDPSFPQMGASYEEPSQIVINNRLLARVNGKSISLIDVVKKMNLFIYEHFPEVFESKLNLFKFYMNNWMPILDDMINTELVLAEAKEKEIKVSEGDVREELEDRFGPNVLTKLTTLNIKYEEAREFIHSELKTRQLLWYKVHAKALQTVTPNRIKLAYKEYLGNNPPSEEWTYQVFSIKGKDLQRSESLAKEAYELLDSCLETFDTIINSLKVHHQESCDDVSMTISDEYSVNAKSIAENHKSVLEGLTEFGFSAPILQVSKIDKSNVYRIFHLKKHKKSAPPPFNDLEEKLKQELLQKEMDQEKKKYIKHLEEKFGFDRKQIKHSLSLEQYFPFSVS